jgi:hypothetical protein
MDIVIFTDDEKHCIEIKYPENGQRPEQMYAACEAIRFLEQLVTEGEFATCYFLMITNLFWEDGSATNPISGYFRDEVVPVVGTVWKPTRDTGEHLDFTGEYTLVWDILPGTDLRYILLPVA